MKKHWEADTNVATQKQTNRQANKPKQTNKEKKEKKNITYMKACY